MKEINCQFCDLVLKSPKELINHYFNKHRKEYKLLGKAEIIVKKLYYNNELSLCQCGCKEIVTYFSPVNNEYSKYKHGHYTRIHNPTRDNPEIGKKAIANAHKVLHESYRNGTRTNWIKGLTKETDERLKIKSEKAKGRIVSKETKKKAKEAQLNYIQTLKEKGVYENEYNKHMKEYWKNETHREEQRKRRFNWFSTQQMTNSKAEEKFQQIFNELDIKYKWQHRIDRKLFDYLLLDKKILLEFDGDFWHTNPIKFPTGQCTKYK